MNYVVRRAFDEWKVGDNIFKSNVRNFEKLLSTGYIAAKEKAYKFVRVIRPFPGCEKAGEVIDTSEWLHTQKLIDGGWVEPCDPPKKPSKRKKRSKTK